MTAARATRPSDVGRRLATVPLALGMVAWLAGCGGEGLGPTAFVGGNLWDGSGAPPVMGAVIVVSGGRIEAAGPADAVEVPRGATEVNLDGRWVVPGLVDAHAHADRRAMPRYLAWGITTIRDMGSPDDTALALRDESALAAIAGPRIYTAGAAIDLAPADRPDVVAVRTADEARRVVDRRRLDDAALVKVMPAVDSVMLAAIIDEAHTLNLPVAAHLGRVDALTAARMGIESIEHMSGVVEATIEQGEFYRTAHADYFAGWRLAEGAWTSLGDEQLARTARALRETGVAQVPTLAMHETMARLTDSSFIAGIDRVGLSADDLRLWNVPALMARAGLTPSDVAVFRRGRPAQNGFLKAFKEAGGVVAAGSDSPGPFLAPGPSLHEEMALLVRAGLTPREALLAATRDGARLLGADTVGVIRPGAVADFLVLEASPLDDIANTRRIRQIVYRGAIRTPAELRALWP